MQGNPYARILQVIRGETADQTAAAEAPLTGLGAAPARMRLGVVAGKVPLAVNVAGIVIPAANLRTSGQHLSVGDQVLLLTEDDQLFFILCRAVKAV